MAEAQLVPASNSQTNVHIDKTESLYNLWRPDSLYRNHYSHQLQGDEEIQPPLQTLSEALRESM